MPTNPNMVAIQTVTVGAGGANSISFTNIPQTYTDLVVKVSARINRASENAAISLIFNGSTSALYNGRWIRGDGSSAVSYSATSAQWFNPGEAVGNTATANTFCNGEIYIVNYAGSTNKSFSSDFVSENNGTLAYATMGAGLWSNTSAITSIELGSRDYSGLVYMQYSTATLYGVTSAAVGAKATGGAIYQDADYFYHVFSSSGTFTPTQSITADCLVIAGGGGGGLDTAGGGGAGGLLAHTSQALSATNYTITVGAGGAGRTGTAGFGTDGSNSQFASLTASIGGGGGAPADNNGRSGGSGGGAGGNNPPRTGGAGTAGQGFAGGNGVTSGGYPWGGGGGGAGEAGNTDGAQFGGDGVSTYSSWGLATSTGENVNGTVWYAGGGVGATTQVAEGGLGGGGIQGRPNGLAVSGGGGGVWNGGGNGGSGVVIVRYTR